MPQAKKLNRRQRRFASELVFGRKKQSEALMASGWKGDPQHAKDTASRMAKLPHVRAYIDKLEFEVLEQEKLTHAAILGDIVKVKDRCMQAEPVVDRKGEQLLTETEDGHLANAWQFDSNGALRSLELLGKYKRLWSENTGAAPIGPGLTVIVQQGVAVQGQQSVQTHRVEVQLPKPGAS